MTEETQPVFSIEKLYVKDMSLEVPNAPQAFLERGNPEISVQLRTNAANVEEGIYDVTLTVNVSAKVAEEGQEEKTLFMVEVAQAGIFQIRNVPADELEPVMMIGCPNILFPYAREAVSDAITRAGFQPVLLSPVNFEAMYQARQEQQNDEAANNVQVQ